MSRARSQSANQPEDFQIKDLAIRGPDAELYDVTDGRRFFYYFEDTARPLAEVVKAGAVRFTLRFGSRPTLVLLSTAYQLKPGELMAGLKVVALEEVPPGHFWFGPKPHFYQLSFDI
jgi:hypothetical protein